MLKKGQSSGSDTMLEILNNCIVFHNHRIYMSAFIYEVYVCGISKYVCSTNKSVVQECVLYKLFSWA